MSEWSQRYDDLWDDPRAKQFAKNVREDLLPKMADSALCAVIVTGGSDVKLMVEIGASIMLDKPIVLAVSPGVEIPPKLRLVADEIIVLDQDDPEVTVAGLQLALQALVDRGVLPPVNEED